MPISRVDETHFAPYDDVPSRLLALASGALREILIDIYGFTFAPLMDVLIAKHLAGVLVRCVCDYSQAQGNAEKVQLQRLVDAGIDVLITESIHGAIDHSKYIVVDRQIVGFGSFNFSASAEKQDNTFSVRNDADLIDWFVQNWVRVHDDGFGKHPEWQIHATADHASGDYGTAVAPA